MLLRVDERNRVGSFSLKCKVLILKCDECSTEFERRWQREVHEQSLHFCGRKCACTERSRRPEWRQRISNSVVIAMSTDEVRERFQNGLEKRDATPGRRKRMSDAAKRKFALRPELGVQHGRKIREKFRDPQFKEHFRSCLLGRVNPWWKPWMEAIKDDIQWSNRIIALFGGACVVCSSTENLCAHHIAPKSRYPELRHDLNNGLALCRNCHIGKSNQNAVHKILRENPERYESLMKSLMLSRKG